MSCWDAGRHLGDRFQPSVLCCDGDRYRESLLAKHVEKCRRRVNADRSLLSRIWSCGTNEPSESFDSDAWDHRTQIRTFFDRDFNEYMWSYMQVRGQRCLLEASKLARSTLAANWFYERSPTI